MVSVQKAFCATGGFGEFASRESILKSILTGSGCIVAEHEMREQAYSLGRRCQGKLNASAFSFALFLWHSLGDCE